MLILNRKPAINPTNPEPLSVVMIGPDIEVKVLRSSGERVILGITAPDCYRVIRAELVRQPEQFEPVAA